ncbi:MAG: hypothetical protein M1814_004593 [Vezdaea aestivalis]|nr:MAG: hypothetical protein M1814_004593 [Vezdaea aestivalis]
MDTIKNLLHPGKDEDDAILYGSNKHPPGKGFTGEGSHLSGAKEVDPTTATSSTGPARSSHETTGTTSTTVGPHKSDTLNKADPRVDGDSSRIATASGTTAGPHKSDTLNKADPTVDSDLSRSTGAQKYSTTTTGQPDVLDRTEPRTERQSEASQQKVLDNATLGSTSTSNTLPDRSVGQSTDPNYNSGVAAAATPGVTTTPASHSTDRTLAADDGASVASIKSGVPGQASKSEYLSTEKSPLSHDQATGLGSGGLVGTSLPSGSAKEPTSTEIHDKAAQSSAAPTSSAYSTQSATQTDTPLQSSSTPASQPTGTAAVASSTTARSHPLAGASSTEADKTYRDVPTSTSVASTGPTATAKQHSEPGATSVTGSTKAADLTGPVHKSSFLNKLDPRVKKADPESHSGTSKAATTEPETTSRSGIEESHTARNTALGTSASIGAAGATSAALAHHEPKAQDTTTASTTASSQPAEDRRSYTNPGNKEIGGSLSKGPHQTHAGNVFDPAVDERGATKRHDHTARDTATAGTGTSTGASTTHGTTPASTSTSTGLASSSAGPHSSDALNKADPRVDSDHSKSTGKDASSTTTGGITTGAVPGPLLASSFSGPAPNTAGPHKSDLLNKADPRVDSDWSKKEPPAPESSSTKGLGASAGSTEGANPYSQSSVDPRIDSHPHSHSTTTERDSHGKETALAGGAVVAGAGSFGAVKHHQDGEKATVTPTQTSTGSSVPVGTAFGGGSRATTVPQSSAPAAIGATHTGTDSYGTGRTSEVIPQSTTATPTSGTVTTGPQDTTTPVSAPSTAGPHSSGAANKLDPKVDSDNSKGLKSDREDHTTRNTAIAGGTAATGGAVAAHEYDKHEAEKLEKERLERLKSEQKEHEKAEKAAEKEHRKEVKAEQKEHEKEVKAEHKAHEKEVKAAEKQHEKEIKAAEKQHEKEEKAAEKQHEKEAKAAEKEAEKQETAEDKDKKGGLLGFLHKNKTHDDDDVEKETTSTSTHTGPNKLHKEPPTEIKAKLAEQEAARQESSIVKEPTTGLPLNTRLGSGAGGTDDAPIRGYENPQGTSEGHTAGTTGTTGKSGPTGAVYTSAGAL